ncbi:hypothetical protein AGOR_G00128760 [Albula goreensis]|uniref:Sarcolipin n=1 Tax=Albula goreensis TaxID=1534307 RepID=A0A8T3DDQ9_9TELE|nr:hypothetical protein AGOR_G00128760 [Albula goreensis]
MSDGVETGGPSKPGPAQPDLTKRERVYPPPRVSSLQSAPPPAPCSPRSLPPTRLPCVDSKTRSGSDFGLQYIRRLPASSSALPGIMDRSVQELFLNFMIVLITVMLMWLLVRSYQS